MKEKIEAFIAIVGTIALLLAFILLVPPGVGEQDHQVAQILKNGQLKCLKGSHDEWLCHVEIQP